MATDDLNRMYEESQLQPPSTYVPVGHSSALEALRGELSPYSCISLDVLVVEFP
jgi:hypothetical protein